MPLEVERKYLNAPLAEIATRLREIGAAHIGCHFEGNIVFDTASLELLNHEKLLRLRVQQWPDHQNIILTYKAPPLKAEGDYKIREEIETEVDNPQNMAQILLNLGYETKARYEKFRDCWVCRAKSGQELKIFLDLLPFMQVVEIESEVADIGLLDKALGLDKLEISSNSYYKLHQQWREKNGLEPAPGFVFAQAEKDRLMADYHIGQASQP